MTWLLILAAVLDGGVAPDAGVELTEPAPTRWQWTHDGGAWLDGNGLTDRLTMRVGETAQVKLPLPIILMQCDQPLLTLGATSDTLLLTAIKAGDTRCGFWFKKNAFPDRTMELHVTAR